MTLVSNNIKYLRRMNGLTQEQFARKIGIKRSLLGAYEEGRANPNLDNLMSIAKVFGTSVDNLLQNDIRKLRETKGVPLPQPPQQLLIDEEPADPQPLSVLMNSHFRSEEPTLPVSKPPVNPSFTREALFPNLHQPVPAAIPPASPVPPTYPAVPVFNRPTTPDLPLGPNHSRNTTLPIEWVSSRAMAEYLASCTYPEYLKTLPTFTLPMLPPGIYRAFEAGDDYPVPGAGLVGSFVQNWYDIRDGNQYLLVVPKGGIVYRRAYNQVKTKGTLLLTSENPAFPGYEVSIKDVLEVWEVKTVIAPSLPNAGPSLERLAALVQELQAELARIRG